MEEGFALAKALIKAHLEANLIQLSVKLVHEAIDTRKYYNLTGNTVTSISAGVYCYGGLKEEISASDMMSPAVRPKLTKGEKASFKSYEGDRVKFTGTVETDRGYGADSSHDFLKGFRTPTNGYAVVVCTGTEYSEHLERIKGMNVLTQAMLYAESIARTSFTKMP